MEQLAILGGKPVRENRISYGHQCIEEDDIAAVTEVLRSDFLTCGPKIAELEKKLCEITGAKYAVVVSNGTAALHCAAMAAGFGQGDEVIVSPITFAASSNCLLYCGATPVFADIKDTTYNIDPEKIEQKINSFTKGVVAVDFTGQACEISAIREICDKHGLVYIEDAAHSIGTRYDGKGVGSLADMTCFSFHPVKTVTSGEGGAITTNSEELYQKLLLARSHGITRDEAIMKNASHGPWYNEQVSLGYNYRITDFQAALLISQLGKLERFSNRRKEIVKRYDEAFSRIPELQVQQEIPESDTTRHLYVLRIRPEALTCDRKVFFESLVAENIGCQVHYLPVYRHSYYESLGYQKGLCPNAESYYDTCLSIPLYPSLSDEDVESVIAGVKKVVEYYKK